jgi:hypothetical protein
VANSNAFLSEQVKVTVDAPSAGATSPVNGTVLDMSGWDGVLWIARLGTPAANNNIRARQSTTSGGTYADLKDTLVTHATNNVLMIDLKRPRAQFVRCQVTRGTTTTIDSLVAIQYRGRSRSFTQPTSTLEQHMSPAEGTA